MNANSVVASAAVVGVTVVAVEFVVLFAAVVVIAAADGAVVVVVVDAAGIVVDAAVAVAVGVAEEAVVADAARHSFPNDVASANQHLVLSAHHAPLSFFAHAGLAAGSSDECCGSEILFVLDDAEAGKGVFVLAVDDV